MIHNDLMMVQMDQYSQYYVQTPLVWLDPQYPGQYGSREIKTCSAKVSRHPHPIPQLCSFTMTDPQLLFHIIWRSLVPLCAHWRQLFFCLTFNLSLRVHLLVHSQRPRLQRFSCCFIDFPDVTKFKPE